MANKDLENKSVSIGFNQPKDPLTYEIGGEKINVAASYGGKDGQKSLGASDMSKFLHSMNAYLDETHKNTRLIAKSEGKKAEEILFGAKDASLGEKEEKKSKVAAEASWGKFGPKGSEKALVTTMTTTPTSAENYKEYFMPFKGSETLTVPVAGVDGVSFKPKQSTASAYRVNTRISFTEVGEFDANNPDPKHNVTEFARVTLPIYKSTNNAPVFRKLDDGKETSYIPATGKPKYMLAELDENGKNKLDKDGKKVFKEVSVKEFEQDPRVAEIMKRNRDGLEGKQVKKEIMVDGKSQQVDRPAGPFIRVKNMEKDGSAVLKNWGVKTFEALQSPEKEESMKVSIKQNKEFNSIVISKNEFSSKDNTYGVTQGISMSEGVITPVDKNDLSKGGMHFALGVKNKETEKDKGTEVGENGGSATPKQKRTRNTGGIDR